MKRLYLTLALIAALVSLTSVNDARADFSGGIGFAGAATFDSTGITGYGLFYDTVLGLQGSPYVASVTGSFPTDLEGVSATFSTFNYNPASSTPFQLWTASDSTDTYSLNATSVVLGPHLFAGPVQFVDVYGTGSFYVDGVLVATGDWFISSSSIFGAFGFESTSGTTSSTSVPEPASALLMISGLASLAVFRQRFI